MRVFVSLCVIPKMRRKAKRESANAKCNSSSSRSGSNCSHCTLHNSPTVHVCVRVLALWCAAILCLYLSLRVPVCVPVCVCLYIITYQILIMSTRYRIFWHACCLSLSLTPSLTPDLCVCVCVYDICVFGKYANEPVCCHYCLPLLLLLSLLLLSCVDYCCYRCRCRCCCCCRCVFL